MNAAQEYICCSMPVSLSTMKETPFILMQQKSPGSHTFKMNTHNLTRVSLESRNKNYWPKDLSSF